ncbi:MAG: polysaccharide deacetylase family protein [Lachnospiraceae bacterium]|nr:polysaccharide deacetylase family protein [Lachnospiraceae bacterium]
MKIYSCFPGGKSKVLTMSYDDGKHADERLVAIFNQNGIKGTFNLNYGLMANPERIDKEKIKELYEGHEIATHTMTHPTISRCPLTQNAKEILEDRAGLESIAGYPVRGHAYPNGSYNEDIKELFTKLGIVYARTADWETGSFELPVDLMEWKATCHHNYNLMKYAKEFAEFKKPQYLKCFYVWGHSYEFDRDNNWELIEEFCSYMGGREDIWYATNIELVDYMKVCRELQFGAAGEFVYNPSAAEAWISVDGRVICVQGGTLVNLKKE